MSWDDSERCFECRKKHYSDALKMCNQCDAPLCEKCLFEHQSDCVLGDFPLNVFDEGIFTMVCCEGKEYCLECFSNEEGSISDENVEILSINEHVVEVVPRCSICLQEHPEYLKEKIDT
jgi:hypothetical protein